MSVKTEAKNYKALLVVPALMASVFAAGFTDKAESNVPSKGITPIKEEVKSFNKDTININVGDDHVINKIVNHIYKDGVSITAMPVKVESNDLNSVRYLIGNYDVQLENYDATIAGDQDVFVNIQKTSSSNISDQYKLNAVDSNVQEENDNTGVISTYKFKLHVSDDSAPIIELKKTNDEITVGDSFNAKDYVTRVYDVIDGDLDYTVDSNVDTENAGNYAVTFKTVDKNGNEASVQLFVTVNEEEEEEAEDTATTSGVNNQYNGSSNVGSSAYGGGIAGAALAQLGRYQDCTALVSNALASQGIYFHAYPAGYLSLGTIVSASQAQPGDIIYYADGGLGVAHVAVYIGNGQAVHGGWQGNQTVIASAYVGSGPVFIRVGK